MKNKFLFLPLTLLVAQTSLAQSNPSSPNSQNAVASVAASGIFISSYQENDQEDYYIPPFTNSAGYVFPSDSYSDINFTHWADGKGGDGQWMFDDGPTVQWSYSWPASSFPQPLPSGTGIETYLDYPDIPPYTNVCNPPTLAEEHCNFSVGKSPFMPIHMQRTADTKMKLATGGVAGSTKMNLWVISATATAYSLPWAISGGGGGWASALTGTPIASQNISILGKTLGSDGNAYVMLPDNATPDATPVVAGGTDFYSFNITAQKYRLTITANGNPLSEDHVRRGAYFCVGQSLTFAPVWSPSVPNVVNTIAHWSLPGEFVNEYVPPPSPENGSGSYIEDATLLANETTSCWYYNKLHPGTASIGLNLQFSNGQTVSIARFGQFDIYRPTISGFQPSPPYYAALVPTNSPNELQLGDNGAHGLMQYNITVSSIAPFSGGFNIVQLVNASRSLANTTYGGGQQQTTDGQFWLDNSSPYFVNGDSGIFSPYYYNSLRFFDQPGYGLNYIFGAYPANLCSINDSFKDYVVFKPDGANSIYVTLGRVFWSWSASTSKSGGVWSNPTYQVNGPSQPDDSDEFPTWPATLYNSGVGTGD